MQKVDNKSILNTPVIAKWTDKTRRDIDKWKTTTENIIYYFEAL